MLLLKLTVQIVIGILSNAVSNHGFDVAVHIRDGDHTVVLTNADQTITQLLCIVNELIPVLARTQF